MKKTSNIGQDSLLGVDAGHSLVAKKQAHSSHVRPTKNIWDSLSPLPDAYPVAVAICR